MYVQPTAPRPIGGVLDDAIRLYRASFARCWPLALVAAALTGALYFYVALRMGPVGGRGTNLAGLAAAMARLQVIERDPSVWGSYAIMMLVFLVVRGAIIARQNAVAIDREDSYGEALTIALARLPSMIVAVIAFGLALAIGWVLLVIPGIWVAGRLELWLVAMCAEELGPFQALGESWRLVERNWWRTVTTMGVAYIIVAVLSLTQALLAGVVVALLKGDSTTALMVGQTLSALITTFTAPMITAVGLAIFYDLRLRHEGTDLAARVRSVKRTA